jgi:SAM-dependent methyltransferase
MKLFPYLRDGWSFLDIGCAFGILAGYVHLDFPAAKYLGFDVDPEAIYECKKAYPYFTWEQGPVEVVQNYGTLLIFRSHRQVLSKFGANINADPRTEFVNRKYNVILHLANDSWQFNDLWKLHIWLLSGAVIMPGRVLLECGWRKDYDGPLQAMNEIKRRYIGEGFRVLEAGEYQFDPNPNYRLNDRHYAVLGKDT